VWCYLCDPTFCRFSKTPACDRHGHRQTQTVTGPWLVWRGCIESRGKNTTHIVLAVTSTCMNWFLLDMLLRKYAIKKSFIFQLHPTNVLLHYLAKPVNCIFSLKRCMLLLPTDTQNVGNTSALSPGHRLIRLNCFFLPQTIDYCTCKQSRLYHSPSVTHRLNV